MHSSANIVFVFSHESHEFSGTVKRDRRWFSPSYGFIPHDEQQWCKMLAFLAHPQHCEVRTASPVSSSVSSEQQEGRAFRGGGGVDEDMVYFFTGFP